MKDILRESPIGLMSINGETGIVIFANQRILEFFDLDDDIVNASVVDVFWGVIDSPEMLLLDSDKQVKFKQTKINHTRNGVSRSFLINAALSDRRHHIVFSFADITNIHDQSIDTLTQLRNRSHFLSELSRLLSELTVSDRIFIVHLDIDNFKLLNNSRGHDCGDYLLSVIGGRISESLVEFSNCFAGRMGGDDFLIAIVDQNNLINDHAIERYVSHLILSISQSISYQDISISISCSAGISVSSQNDSLSELIINVDIALRRAKIKGKDNFVFYHKSMSKTTNAYELSSCVSEGIVNNELFFQYQPKVCLSTAKIVGIESLMRWKNWNGLIHPGQFIPIAEDTGKIIEITEWAVQSIVYQIAGWLDRGFDVPMVSINVSPQSLISNRLVSILSQLIELTQVPVSNLCIELIESTFIYDHIPVKKNLDDIIKMGIKLSLDDFGTGYSSMAMLKEYDFSEIKIDRGFITEIDTNAINQAIVRAIVQIGNDLNKTVVAEGIETAEQLRLAKDLGCHIGQGYYFSRPLCVNDIERLFENLLTNQQGLVSFGSSLIR